MARFHLPPDWNVPEEFARRLGDKVGRQRVMAADGHLLLVLHEPPRPDETERVGRPLWRDPDGEWRSRGVGDGPQVLKRHVAEFVVQLDALETLWEEASTATDHYLMLRTIAPLHRTIRNLYAVLQEARTQAPDDREIINARDSVGEIERTIELLYGDVKSGMDFMIAYQAEQQAEQSRNMAVAGYRLNLLAAAFLPITALAAVFGMHLTHGLEGIGSPVYFWGLLGVGLAGGLLLARIIARKPMATESQ